MMQKQLTTAKNDANTWKNKFQNEATPRIEELEDAKCAAINSLSDVLYSVVHEYLCLLNSLLPYMCVCVCVCVRARVGLVL